MKEFRSPVRNNSGLVYELPGGSSLKPGVDHIINAQHELSEEIGLHVDDVSRFQYVDTKQLCATLSSHVSSLFKIELTQNEFELIKKSINENKTFGLQEDTEIIYLEIIKLKEIMKYPFDFSMIGMILGSLINE